MNIEGMKEIKTSSLETAGKVSIDAVETESSSITQLSSPSDRQVKQVFDKATGLLQAIVTDKLSDQVIRKMPADEFLKLLSLLDEMLSGSVDNHV